MTKILLRNPNFEEEIKVKEDYGHILNMLEWLERGNIDYLHLQQVEPNEAIITINPKNFAKLKKLSVVLVLSGTKCWQIGLLIMRRRGSL